MKNRILITAGALGCATAMAVPGTAGAGSFDTAVREVKMHTSRADSALDRAEQLVRRDRDRDAARHYAGSRREMAAARRDAARLRRSADTDSERAAAARAEAYVADQEDENVEQLAGMLDEASGRLENSIARAALSDARGRDKSAAVIAALIERGVPSRALPGLSRALAAIALGRDEEVEEASDALVEDEVSRRNQGTVARTLGESLSGQSDVAGVIATLIASEALPAEALAGLQRAYDSATAEQEQNAQSLDDVFARLPSHVRDFVTRIVAQARERAQSMRENRPGRPDGTPGRPEGTPGGAPEGTPTGQPESTPTGPPAGTPTGPPAGTPAG